MNLVIDVGNTLVKLAVFDFGKLRQKKTCIKKDFINTLAEISETFPKIETTLVSAVGNFTEHQFSKLKQLAPVIKLDHQTEVPFLNKYSTPQTLGVDRIALISAAAMQYPNKNVLVIDVGTCITYDFLNMDNEYLGGAISPGIGLRYRAMHTFTEKLPLLDASQPKELIGNSTALSMHSGAMNGVLYEIDGFIEAYKKNYENLTVILTGGDSHFLSKRLKSSIFAHPNLLLRGINCILELNKH
jgi:type III pantothenate kinase